MSLRAKQQRKQQATLARRSDDVMSIWYHVKRAGLLFANVRRTILTAVMLEEERIILRGTRSIITNITP